MSLYKLNHGRFMGYVCISQYLEPFSKFTDLMNKKKPPGMLRDPIRSVLNYSRISYFSHSPLKHKKNGYF
jgi:hypothetical protein